jgi:class 3 adenylate cyclase
MFTDMVGYTALGQRNEELAIALMEEQRRLVRPIFAVHSGREVKTIGDAFLVEFPSALDAVKCAYEIQRMAREYSVAKPAEQKIRLRVGVHLGDVVESGGDITGDAVNLASRIEPLAEEGGICLTSQVYEQVRNKIELPLTTMGKKTLNHHGACRSLQGSVALGVQPSVDTSGGGPPRDSASSCSPLRQHEPGSAGRVLRRRADGGAD